MRTKILNALKVSMLALVLTLGLSYAYAWTAPTQAPTGGNIDVPLNTGSADQKKFGSLQVRSMSAGAPAVAGYGLTTSDTNGIYSVATGGSGVGVFAYTPSTGYGLYGQAGGSGTGVLGTSATGVGINGVSYATQGAAFGVQGVSESITGIALHGEAMGSMGLGALGEGGLEGVRGIGVYGLVGRGTIADLALESKGIRFPDQTQQVTAASWKQCEGSNASTYNEAFTVPTTWSRAQCLTLLQAHIVGDLSWWRVGCLSSTGPTAGDFGAMGGGLPSNNSCGWDIPLPPPPRQIPSPLYCYKHPNDPAC